MPERDLRRALKKRVEEYGGEIRAVAWLGRRNAPDVVCLFPIASEYAFHCIQEVMQVEMHAHLHPFVETKAPDGKPNIGQQREHKRLRQSGCVVLVISTFEQLDLWLPPMSKPKFLTKRMYDGLGLRDA